VNTGGAAPATTRRRLPVFTSLHGYQAGWLRGDLEYYRTVAEAAGAVSAPPTGTPTREA
jgi:hypothetical protein